MNENMKSAAGYVVLSFVWGSTWLFIRLGLESFTVLFSAGFRFTLAVFFIFLIMKYKGIKLDTSRKAMYLYIYLTVFSFLIPFALVYWGQQFIPSGLASVLFGVFPFFVAILTHFFLPGEKIGVFKITGIVLGFTGIAVIFADSLSIHFGDYIWGMGAVILSAFLQSTVLIAIKKFGSHIHPLTLNFLPMAFAAVGFLILSVLIEDMSYQTFDSNGLISILYLAVFGSIVTFTTYYWLLGRINIILLSLLAFITPVVAVFMGWIFLEESLTTQQLFGSGIVLLGILVANVFGAGRKFEMNKAKI